MKTIQRDISNALKTAFVACCLALVALMVAVPGSSAQQVSYNPFLVQGIVSPAPMLPVEFNGTGVVAFDVGNTGSTELDLRSGQEMRLVVSLSKGVPNVSDPNDPVAALAALGGDGVEWFDWTYTPGNATFEGIQRMTIPGSTPGFPSRRTITIQYRVTENSFLGASPTVSNGFNANLTPPPYSNPQPTDDDTVSSYTFVQARDYGDAPISYGEAWHNIDLTKNAGGLYNRYMFLGSYVDPEDAYQASADALGDDNNQTGGLGVDDEDGVTFPTLVVGQGAVIPVAVTIRDAGAGQIGFLNAWIDWNGDGDFLDSGEQILVNQFVFASGPVPVNVTVPSNAITDRPIFARFRIGTFNAGPTGGADYGEVEDYMIQILSSQPVADDDVSVANPPGPVTLAVLFNDEAADGRTLDPETVQIIGADVGSDGKILTVEGEGIWSVDPDTGKITFTPEEGFTLDPTPIEYTVRDDLGNISNSAKVTIDYVPVATNDTSTGNTPGTAVKLDVTANDTDGDTVVPATVQIVGAHPDSDGKTLTVPGQGVWSVDPVTGEITFTPEENFTGNPAPIQYTVEDDEGNISNPALVTVTYNPTAVTLLSFDVVPVDTTTLRVEWSTATEVDTQGFHLWRSETDDRSQAVRITEEMIEAQGSLLSGAEYVFIDGPLQPDTQYYYWLQEIETNGSATEFGPATGRTPVEPGEEPDTHHRLFLPFLNR
jgi:CshA-type fibril repeat protein